MLWKEKFQSYKLYARPEAKISPRVMISVVSQYVIGFTCHNESMLIGLFRQRQCADERRWLFVSADVRGAGTRDEPLLRTSAWEARAVRNAEDSMSKFDPRALTCVCLCKISKWPSFFNENKQKKCFSNEKIIQINFFIQKVNAYNFRFEAIRTQLI